MNNVKSKIYRAKCPNCCPDHVVDFKQWGANEKRCTNCHHVLPLRRIKPTGELTPSQERYLARVLKAFGGSIIKQEMIGRNVWVEVRNDKRHWMLGDVVYGTIGPRGQLDLKMPRVGTGDALIKDDIGINVYLKS